MTIRNIQTRIHTLVPVLLLALALTGCQKTPVPWDLDSKVELPATRAFILNQGAADQNDASLTFFAPGGEREPLPQLYFLQNDRYLGDTGQDLLAYNNELYLSLSGSRYIARLNASGVERARYQPGAELGDPRSLALHQDKLYVSCYGGTVLRLNALTLQEEARLQTGGANLEEITVCGDRLFVANSWALKDGQYTYLNQVFVIDLPSFTLERTLTVDTNPNFLRTYGNEVYLLSFGDYGATDYSLQRIEPDRDFRITPLAAATHFTLVGNTLLMVYCQTDWTTYATHTRFFSYDLRAQSPHTECYLHNLPESLASENVYGMASDPFTGEVYICTTDYYTSGKIYRFDAQGQFTEQFSSQGLNPWKLAFLTLLPHE